MTRPDLLRDVDAALTMDRIRPEVARRLLRECREGLADLRRYAEAMFAVMCRDCPGRFDCPHGCHEGCAALEYRTAHPKPPEKP